MKKLLLTIMLICPLFACWSCLGALKATTTFAVPAIKVAEGAVNVSKIITEREEYYLGRTVAAKIMSIYHLSTNQKLARYVNLVGSSLAMNSSRPVTYGGYHFAVLDSSELNAMACPGGIIFITSGLLGIVKSEDELAAVLAHEISHIINKDGMKSIQRSKWTQLIAVVGSAAAQVYGSEGFGQLVSVFEGSVEDVVSTLVVKGYGREQELGADQMAVSILAASGYNQVAILNVLEYYKSREGSDDRGFFKTHPGVSERIENIVKLSNTPINLNDKRKRRFEAAVAK